MNVNIADKSNRITWIDFAKGIGMILVVMGHAIPSETFSLYLHAFHMPLFFIISGYLTKAASGKSVSQFIRGKAKALLIPYAVFGVFTYLFWVVLYRGDIAAGIEDGLSPLFHLLWINSTGLKISGEFWFLTALFFASLILDFLKRNTNKAGMSAAVIALSLFGCYFRRLFDRQLPWSILSACTGVGFLYIGFLLRNADHRAAKHLMNLKWYEMMLLLGAAAVLIVVNGEVNMRRSLYSNVLLFYFNAAAVSLVLLNLCKRFCDGAAESKMRRFIESVGRDSITYVCLDSMVLKMCNAVLRKCLPLPTTGVLGLCSDLGQVVIAVGILYFINKWFHRAGLKFLLGK